jgi:hypothetical protein
LHARLPAGIDGSCYSMAGISHSKTEIFKDLVRFSVLAIPGLKPACAQGASTADAYRRTLAQRVNDPLILAFGKASSSAGQPAPEAAAEQLQLKAQQQQRPPASERVRSVEGGGAPERSFLADAQGLPECVHLLTLKDNGDGRVLLRLAHLYQARLPPQGVLPNLHACLSCALRACPCADSGPCSLALAHLLYQARLPQGALPTLHACVQCAQGHASCSRAGRPAVAQEAPIDAPSVPDQVGEQSECAREPSSVDLNALFEGLSFDAVEEAALAAGQKHSQVGLFFFMHAAICLPLCPRHACYIVYNSDMHGAHGSVVALLKSSKRSSAMLQSDPLLQSSMLTAGAGGMRRSTGCGGAPARSCPWGRRQARRRGCRRGRRCHARQDAGTTSSVWSFGPWRLGPSCWCPCFGRRGSSTGAKAMQPCMLPGTETPFAPNLC